MSYILRCVLASLSEVDGTAARPSDSSCGLYMVCPPRIDGAAADAAADTGGETLLMMKMLLLLPLPGAEPETNSVIPVR